MSVTRRLVKTGSLCVIGAILAACSGGPPGSPSGTTSGNTLIFAEFNPFSGPDAAFGPEMVVACDAAVRLINSNGGVLGHKTTCKGFDTHGDPADAVAAANQMIATTSNLAGVIGPSSTEALATVPILNRAHLPMFADTGQAAFDHSTATYFWRLSPADDVKGYAMAIWAHKQGYTRGAAIYGNDVGSQSNVPTLVRAFSLLGGTMVSNQAIALDQQYQVGVQPYAPTAGPAYGPFRGALYGSKAASAANLAVYSTDPYALGYYDSVNIMALAMIAAKSTSPAKYNAYITTVSNPGTGKVVVHTYAAGKAALASGKKIQYIGASGPAVFNKWHNSTGAFEVAGYLAPGKIRLAGTVSAAAIAALSGR